MKNFLIIIFFKVVANSDENVRYIWIIARARSRQTQLLLVFNY